MPKEKMDGSNQPESAKIRREFELLIGRRNETQILLTSIQERINGLDANIAKYENSTNLNQPTNTDMANLLEAERENLCRQLNQLTLRLQTNNLDITIFLARHPDFSPAETESSRPDLLENVDFENISRTEVKDLIIASIHFFKPGTRAELLIQAAFNFSIQNVNLSVSDREIKKLIVQEMLALGSDLNMSEKNYPNGFIALSSHLRSLCNDSPKFKARIKSVTFGTNQVMKELVAFFNTFPKA
jgi:hypothetical protein